MCSLTRNPGPTCVRVCASVREDTRRASRRVSSKRLFCPSALPTRARFLRLETGRPLARLWQGGRLRASSAPRPRCLGQRKSAPGVGRETVTGGQFWLRDCFPALRGSRTFFVSRQGAGGKKQQRAAKQEAGWRAAREAQTPSLTLCSGVRSSLVGGQGHAGGLPGVTGRLVIVATHETILRRGSQTQRGWGWGLRLHWITSC